MARALNVLLIEDDDNDVLLFRMGTRAVNTEHKIYTVQNGIEAIEFLQDALTGRREPFPDILVVDLKMPEMDGLELLSWLKKEEEFRMLPVVVLTGSPLKDNVAHARNLGARSYLLKPVDLGDFTRQLESFFSFWSLCELPGRPLAPITGC